MKEWRKLLRNNKTAGRLVSIPKSLVEEAGFEDWDEIEGKWSVWAKQGKILVLELRDAPRNPLLDTLIEKSVVLK